MKDKLSIVLSSTLLLSAEAAWATGVVEPPIALAQSYQQGLALDHYLVSEKLDGMRAYWDGERLLSRAGNPIAAPDWFTAELPKEPLDGELWLGRGQFEALMAVVRDRIPDEAAWRSVRFMLFDLPSQPLPFEQRYRLLAERVEQWGLPHLELVRHEPVASDLSLDLRLAAISEAGGEGLMLRHRQSLYRPGRGAGLLKYKAYEDSEAVVIAQLPGKGKYEGMMGSLLVEDPQGRRFKIGSGFSDAQRRTPPAVGSVVTYRFNGRTGSGLPRFARFERVFISL
ncbi:DNA ligase [Ferrimonas pelagia]